jgi:hypothetical protein
MALYCTRIAGNLLRQSSLRSRPTPADEAAHACGVAKIARAVESNEVALLEAGLQR